MDLAKKTQLPQLEDIQAAAENLKGIVQETTLMPNLLASEKYQAEVYFKREDLQVVRSYKIRGAYNKISQLNPAEQNAGVVCASAGNHAQGVAYACRKLGIKATIFMPMPTPKQKVQQVRFFGKEWVQIVLEGDTFDDAYAAAKHYCQEHQSTFIPPFDDPKIVEGQGTVALEILKQHPQPIDVLILPVGGGGLAAGVATVFKTLSPNTKIIAVEPEGAAAFKKSMELGENTSLQEIDKFVDGAAVKRMGELNFEICKNKIDQILTVSEGKVCTTILELYNQDAIVVEPAGALSIAALEQLGPELKDKTVVCIVSGSNNDIARTEEIRERALLYQGLKHYFIINFPQRAGALREFLNDVLGPNDDIVHFEYTKKTSREQGPALVGIELKSKEDYQALLERLEQAQFSYTYLNENPMLFSTLL